MAWVMIGMTRLVDLGRIEHIAIIGQKVASEYNWRDGHPAMITLDSYDGHHYVVNYSDDESAQADFARLSRTLR